jgi:hypothetical protein
MKNYLFIPHSKTTSFWALKLHCFGLQNDVVLTILSLFFLKKKKEKKKEKGKYLKKSGGGGGERNRGWPATPLAKNGVAGHRGGWSHPHGRSGGGRTNHPQTGRGGGYSHPKSPPPPPPPPPKKKKKRKMGFGLLGVAGPPPRTWGWIRPQPPPKGQNLFFFFLGFWGWSDHPLGHGGGRTTPRPAVGVAPTTPLAKNGVAGHPIFGQGGGWSHPRFLSPPPPLLFLIFSFFFSFFFLKKNNDKMAKTTSF